MSTDTGFVILTRSKGKRRYEYAMTGTGDALCVVSDYLTVSEASDQVHGALVALQESGTYTGVGGTWNLERVNEDGLPRWYELHESAAGTDPHYLNRVRANEIRARDSGHTTAIRADLVSARLTIQRAVDGHDDADLPDAAAMLDNVLRAMCPHDPNEWHTAPDTTGRMLTTCSACNASWYE